MHMYIDIYICIHVCVYLLVMQKATYDMYTYKVADIDIEIH